MTRTHLKTIAVVTGHDQPKLSKGQQVKTWLKKVQREAAKMDDYGGCPF